MISCCYVGGFHSLPCLRKQVFLEQRIHANTKRQSRRAFGWPTLAGRRASFGVAVLTAIRSANICNLVWHTILLRPTKVRAFNVGTVDGSFQASKTPSRSTARLLVASKPLADTPFRVHLTDATPWCREEVDRLHLGLVRAGSPPRSTHIKALDGSLSPKAVQPPH